MGGYNRLCLADSFRLHPIQTLLNLGAADGSPGPLVPLHVPLPRASMSEQDESTAPKDGRLVHMIKYCPYQFVNFIEPLYNLEINVASSVVGCC